PSTAQPTTRPGQKTISTSRTPSTTVPPCGTFLLKWGVKSGTRGGELDYPVGVATDGSGNVYVADRNNDRIQKFDANGTFLTKWGSYGSGNGELNFPVGVAPDGSGNVYVGGTYDGRSQKLACP